MTVSEWDAKWSRYWRAYCDVDPYTRSLPWMVAQQRALPGMVKLYGERPKAPDDALWLLLVDAIRAATVVGAAAQLPAPIVAALKDALRANSSSPLAPMAKELLKELALKEGKKLMSEYDWKLGLVKAGKQLGFAILAGLGGALASVAADPSATAAFKEIPLVGPIAAGAVVMGLTWVANYLKNR